MDFIASRNITPSARTVATRAVILNAANLLSEQGENGEYDRALCELVADTLGLSSDDHEIILTVLRALKD